ncbi:hypothetical protein EVAR_91494_1 [Eumeta japonica]|uniref:Uncharacterized protein n=1 Tax=Eumeta variegata TaxID=151549 RepID=A0A4C1VBE5_EUMVA|nr:hypothetical protein EVAR_91494_1 [Eumeta japonica]
MSPSYYFLTFDDLAVVQIRNIYYSVKILIQRNETSYSFISIDVTTETADPDTRCGKGSASQKRTRNKGGFFNDKRAQLYLSRTEGLGLRADHRRDGEARSKWFLNRFKFKTLRSPPVLKIAPAPPGSKATPPWATD